MTDLSKTIIPDSSQINFDDLVSGPMTITVTKVTGNDSGHQPINIHFDGSDGRVFRPCKTVRRVLVKIWGPDGKAYVGRSMTLYGDPSVKFGGIAVGGIRISHMSHIDQAVTIAVTVSRAQRRPYTVKPLPPIEQNTTPAEQGEAQGAESDPADTIPHAELYKAAEAAALMGLRAYQKHWAEIGPSSRKALAGDHEFFKVMAQEVSEG